MLGLETHEQPVSVLRTVWVKCVMKCFINHVLVCLRPEMAVKSGFTKCTDKLCFERNNNLRFYCSRNSDHKIIFMKICVWSSDLN